MSLFAVDFSNVTSSATTSTSTSTSSMQQHSPLFNTMVDLSPLTMSCKEAGPNCTTCYKQSDCHFCAFDQQCHAKGSVYGCTKGIACHDADQCLRPESEFIGYQYPNRSTVTIMWTVGGVLILLMLVLTFFVSSMVKRKHVYTLLDEDSDGSGSDVVTTDYVRLDGSPTRKYKYDRRQQQSQTVDLSGSPATTDDLLNTIPPRSAYRKVSLTTRNNGSDNSYNTSNVYIPPSTNSIQVYLPSSTAQPPSIDPRNPSYVASTEATPTDSHEVPTATNKRWSRLLTLTKCLLYTTTFTVISLCTLGIFYYPQVPQYSICTKTVQWQSIFTGWSKGKLTAHVDMHFSIYNPNRFSMNISRMTADFSYLTTHVATATLHNVTFDEGSVTDFVLPADFETDPSTAFSMYTAYSKHAMFLDLAVSIDTSLLLLRKELTHIATNTTVPNIPTNIPDDRRWCKCPAG